MAQRGNRPKPPESVKGGVRGTHGLGDKPRPTRYSKQPSRTDEPDTDNPETDTEYREEHNLETVKTHGPGPKDAGRGTATKKPKN